MGGKSSEEVELKLELAPDARSTVDWPALFGAPPTMIAQHAVYFDTPDRALAAAGFSLRIRTSGTKRLQTVKAHAAAAGLFARAEWEFAVEGDIPVLDDRTPVAATLGAHTAKLGPVFTIENERMLWDLGGIEVALDHARVATPDAETPIDEIELEAKGSAIPALFALARRIDAATPVQIAILSKADRGYRLLAPPAPAEKARPVALAAGITAAEAFCAIARACLRQFRLNAATVIERGDPGALHQARVALRRLRSALAVHAPLFPRSAAARWDDELRWLAGELGAARDLDVLATRAGPGALADRLRPAREAAYARATAALLAPRSRHLMLDLVEWLTIGDWRTGGEAAAPCARPVRGFAAEALDRLHRKVRKRGRHFARLDDAARHRLRKTVKKLRYTADFFAPLFADDGQSAALRDHAKLTEALQDRLGALNDIATAPQLLRSLSLDTVPEAVALFATGDRDRQLAEARAAFRALRDAAPFWR